MGQKAVTTANYTASILQNASATSKLAKVGFAGAGFIEGYIKSKVDFPYDVNPHLIEDLLSIHCKWGKFSIFNIIWISLMKRVLFILIILNTDLTVATREYIG